MKKHPPHQNQFATKIVSTLLFFLLPASSLNALHAREIKLIKSGGVPLYYFTNTIPSGLTPIGDYIAPIFNASGMEMTFTETLFDANRNWTEMFRIFVNSINSDPQKQTVGVSFKIIIDAPYQNKPIIHRQVTSLRVYMNLHL